MKTEIVVSLCGAVKRSPNREPDEYAYFTEVFGFPSRPLGTHVKRKENRR